MERKIIILLFMTIFGLLVMCGSARAVDGSGLIAHWKFDEGSRTIAHDSAGENHGTLMNGPTWTLGQIGGALGFDGDDDYVEITGYKGISGTSARTCAAWIKTGTNGQIISWGEETIGRKWTFRVDFNGTVRAEVAGGGINSSTVVDDGAWHHVAVVWENDGSPYICDAMLYVDGQQETTYCPGDEEMNTASYANVRIGKAFIGNRNFDGPIDDVRIYDKALSAGEVEQLYQDGLSELVGLEIVGPNEVAEDFTAQYKAIAHYENGSAVDVTASADWSVEPNDIADIDAGLLETEEIYESEDITIYAQYTEGENTEVAQKEVSVLAICPGGSALEFDGVDDYVELGTIYGTDDLALAGSNFTICSWIKPNLTGDSYQRIVDKSNGSGGANGYAFFVLLDGRISIDVASNAFRSDGSVITAGIWQHVAVTGDGSDYQLYVEGLPVSGSFAKGSYNSPPSVNTNMRIGTWNHSTAREFNGSIDEVAIYNRSLSAEEIWASMHIKLRGDELNLVAYWNFDEGQGQIVYDLSPNGNNGTLGSTEDVDDSDPAWVESDAPVGICTPVAVDIKPGSCPNPLNVASRGVLPAAILGTEEFDVTTIDAGSIFLEGIPTIRTSYEDVATAVTDGNECECTTEGPDGYTDLTLKFRTQEVVEELINTPGGLAEGQTLALELRGELTNGRIIAGSDCVVLVGNVPRHLFIRISDINSDGVINMVDLAQLAQYWLESYEVEY